MAGHTDHHLPGRPVTVRPGIVRVLARNPSPMTLHGTNSYILGHDTLCVVDPGPDDAGHLAALLAAIGGRPVSHVVVTHSHLDHSPLARPLAAATGAEICGFGDATAGRSAVMERLARTGAVGGGEGVDAGFRPDRRLADGEVMAVADGSLRVLHTPGHMGNHICLVWGDAVLTGDHVMGWASSLVSPPDGDLTDFMASCRRLRALEARLFLPGHGAPVTDPTGRLDWLIGHREMRETGILAALTLGPATAAALTDLVYHDVAPPLRQAASRNVLAHLIDLTGKDRVSANPAIGPDALFRLI